MVRAQQPRPPTRRGSSVEDDAAARVGPNIVSELEPTLELEDACSYTDEGTHTTGDTSVRAVAPPSRLDSLLITNQIQEYCSQINRHTHSSFSKLFLTGSLHKKAAP